MLSKTPGKIACGLLPDCGVADQFSLGTLRPPATRVIETHMEQTKMRKILIPAVATALFAVVSIANAADATGVIKSIDTVKDTVTLADGATYSAPASMKLSTYKVGQKVAITYTQSNGKMEVSAMKPAS